MTISELIERLEALKAEHGDKDVYIGHSAGIGELFYVEMAHEGVILDSN